MTDEALIEKVARAIYEALPYSEELKTWDLLPQHSHHRLAAKFRATAALSACGCREMKEALNAFVSDCTNEECERCITARSALALTEGR